MMTLGTAEARTIRSPVKPALRFSASSPGQGSPPALASESFDTAKLNQLGVLYRYNEHDSPCERGSALSPGLGGDQLTYRSFDSRARKGTGHVGTVPRV